MRPFGLIATAALSVYLLGAGVAHADARWSAPTTVTSGSYQFCCRPSTLVFTGDGHALATLGGSEGASVLAAAPGTSAFTQIGRAGIVDQPAVYGRRGVAYLRTPRRAPEPGSVKFARLGVSLGSVPGVRAGSEHHAGSLGRFRPLARIRGLDLTARIAADRVGNVAAAWLEPRPGRAAGIGQRVLVRVALRRPGKRAFGPARTIGEARPFGDFTPLELAYGADGELIVAFQHAHGRHVGQRDLRLVARVKFGGRDFGATQTLGPLLGSSSVSIAAARTVTGPAVIAWGTQDAGEGLEEPWRVRAAVLHAGAQRFSKAQLLDPGSVAYPVAGVSAAISPGGTATVAWSGVEGAQPYPVRVATARSAGRFGAMQQLAPNGAIMGLATAPDGSTTVLWGSLPPDLLVQDDVSPDQIFASHRQAGRRAFGSPEPVSPRVPAGVGGGRLAIDPLTARPAALWTSGSGPVDTALYSTRAG